MYTRSALVLLLVAAATASGQYTWVVPPAHATVEGTGAANFIFRNDPRTYQMTLPGADFVGAPGDALVGFTTRMRRTSAGSWPSQDRHFASYDVYIGELAIPLGPLLETVADNIVPGTDVQVRSGPMTILAGSFTSDGTLPNPFGTHTVDFQTPFVIDPTRNYVITIRHTGNGVDAQTMDRLASGENYSGRSAADYTATTTGGVANWTIPQFYVTDSTPPCYADCNYSGHLTIDDFICFINEFASAQSLPPSQQQTHYANCTGATMEPFLTIDDFLCFINEFAAGCP
jgi:hypothetical protein